MENSTLYITVETLTRIIFPLLFVLVGAIVYRWLMPDLSPSVKRLATFILLAQVLTISFSIYREPASSFEVWLWDLSQEWNLPATLASTQLALVGGVALATAWFSMSRKAFQRLYFVGIALVFLYLAFDEYFKLHEYRIGWNVFVNFGAVVVVITLLVAARSSRRSWKWHSCMLIGLAISALGAIHVETFGSVCGDFGVLFIDQCPQHARWPLEEILEFIGIWLTLIAVLGHYSYVSSRARCGRLALFLFPALWIALIVIISPVPPVARQVDSPPAAIEFESGAGLHAYRLNRTEYDLTIRLFLSPERWDYNGLGYSIHLVDQVTGDSIVSRDTYAHRRLEFSLAPGFIPVYRQWMRMGFPLHAPTNRALWIALTLWHESDGKFVSQKIISSDHRMLNETQVVLGEMVLQEESKEATIDPLAEFDNGFILDAAEMPESARAGETLTIPFTWRSDVDGGEDHVQFLHLGHEESGEWWVYDQQPLGERLPTRLWYKGLADSETWQVPLPQDLVPGQYIVFTGLYRTRDQERVPARDTVGGIFRDARVPIGTITIE